MPNNYVLLETIALTQSAASVTFDNLPTSGYTDLKIVVSARSTGASDWVTMAFNGSTTGYSNRHLQGNGSAASSFTQTTYEYAMINNQSGSTANTFSSSEVYIPNYRSSVAKSYSIDTAGEANATTAYMEMNAQLWNNTAAITSIAFTSLVGSLAAGSTFSLYGIAAFGTTPVLAPKATGGNIVANDGTYWYHAFTSSGYFVPQVGLTADVLVVAGGGGGGFWQNSGGGGGAGGLRSATSQSLANGTNYACTIGAGGAGGAYQTAGSKGTNSTFNSLSSTGGGGGGSGYSSTAGNATTGGSGGGGWAIDPSTTTNGAAGNQGGYSPVEGFAGGNGSIVSSFGFSGGGGGAGAAGQDGSSGGAGGAGSSSFSTWGIATLTGQNVSGTYWYAGGGGGGKDTRGGGTAGSGGNGGGGQGGGGSADRVATSAIANTGGGGGGGGNTGGSTQGSGGSGVIIIRYPIA